MHGEKFYDRNRQLRQKTSLWRQNSHQTVLANISTFDWLPNLFIQWKIDDHVNLRWKFLISNLNINYTNRIAWTSGSRKSQQFWWFRHVFSYILGSQWSRLCDKGIPNCRVISSNKNLNIFNNLIYSKNCKNLHCGWSFF